MARILVLGAGLNGLTTALLLTRDGHDVTVLERDPEPAPTPDRAWDDWSRRGVNQFRLPHFMLPRWWAQIRTDLPEAAAAVEAAGGLRLNTLTALPESRRGSVRDGDERFETVTARRPVLEAALAALVPVRRGVTVTGLATAPGPRVTGVLTDTGRTMHADLVVDCGGRRSALGAWLVAAGARVPHEERADCGYVYYARHFHGSRPAIQANLLQHYDSLSLITLPGDHDTWCVVVAVSSRDHALRALRDPDRWQALVGRYPLVADWAAATPITGVDVMAGIEDRIRHLVVDGDPVATGIVAVGDAWACTSPSVGRGASIGVLHARLLRDLLRDTDPDDHDKFARRFHELTAQQVEPAYRATLWMDTHRLAEIDADIAGVRYGTDDMRWTMGKALFAASLSDPSLARDYGALAAFISTPDEVFARPGVREAVVARGMGAPQYPLPGPTRAEVLRVVSGR